MKRNDFLKKLGLGALALSAAPTIIKAEAPIEPVVETTMAIDILSISNMSVGGREISPAEILRIMKETGMLLYRSSGNRGQRFNPPMVFKGEIKAIDISKK